MKSFSFPFVLLAVLQISFAQCIPTTVLKQDNWRWRNNDGNETSATWKTPEKNSINYNNGVLRLRVTVVNISLGNNGLAECPFRSVQPLDTLQYSTDTTNNGSWKNIANDPSKAFKLAGINAFVVQNAVTTAQLSGGGNFSPGRMMISDSAINNMTIGPNFSSRPYHTEMEWAIVGTPNLLPNTTYYFRQGWNIYQYWNGSRYIYSTYPTLTTSASLPVKLTRFTATAEDKKAKLEWETASEQNNDRFEVQRSPDQRTWQTLAVVKGKGNTSMATDYRAYDEKPILGTNYYRLQQFDKDGKSTLSDVRVLKMAGGGVAASVWPNPVKDIINFSMEDVGAAKLEIILSDVSGRILHQQSFFGIVANAVNKINLLQKPTPGIYLLQLKSNDFSVNTKVVIQ